MSGSTGGGFGDWFSNLFGTSSGNAAGLGSTDATFSEQPARPQTQEQINAAYRGGPGYTPQEQTALGMDAKQWAAVGKSLGGMGQGMGGQQAATPQQQQQRAASQGLHQGNPAAFNSLLTQILQRRAAMPGAATQPPPGLMGASRG